MKNKIHTFFLLLVSFCLFLFTVPMTYAVVSCQPIYGGGQTCIVTETISVNKTVMNPTTGKMVENLGINDPKYLAGELVTFQITVTNTSDKTINHIDVKDTLPQFTVFNAGPGSFDAKTNTLTLDIDNLNPNDARVITMIGKVADVNKLSQSQSVTCVVNLVTAVADTKATSSDNAQFCIEKKAAPITKGGFPIAPSVPVGIVPATGAESWVLLSLIPAGISGLLLRKYSIKKEVLN